MIRRFVFAGGTASVALLALVSPRQAGAQTAKPGSGIDFDVAVTHDAEHARAAGDMAREQAIEIHFDQLVQG